ncbi:MAG TPA: hypothetical protein VFB12_21765 [Ktedonobacteraceae bacterium]|nr:hypothetical protein [Ktedonobacteraceae bacterium]
MALFFGNHPDYARIDASDPFLDGRRVGRNQLPHRSTLSRFLAALDQPTVEALRTGFCAFSALMSIQGQCFRRKRGKSTGKHAGL